jgi:S1-C subfamily serine protease
MPDLHNYRLRAERAFPGIKPSDALNRVRAIVGSKAAMPANEEGRMAVAAMEKLQDPNLPEPTPAELAALEFMIRITRPAPLVHQGRPDDIEKIEQADAFPAWHRFQDAIQPFAHCIGRVDRAASSLARSESIGTGFLVKSGLLLTNKHVLMALSRGTGRLERGQGVVRFQVEAGNFSADVPVAILNVVATHREFDATLLALDMRALDAGRRLPRIADKAVDEGADVVAAGYPAKDSARNPLFIGNIFHDDFDVLRASPGQVSAVRPNGFSHDCSTLGGNSGSPVFDLRTAEVVGLHRSGEFLWSNEAVDGPTLAAFVAAQ